MDPVRAGESIIALGLWKRFSWLSVSGFRGFALGFSLGKSNGNMQERALPRTFPPAIGISAKKFSERVYGRRIFNFFNRLAKTLMIFELKTRPKEAW